MRKPKTVIHDIHVARGEEGRRLAAMQAQAILDVLTWAAEQKRRTAEPSPSSPDELSSEEPTGR